MTRRDAADILYESAEIFEERGKVYGNNYTVAGEVLSSMFSSGLFLSTVSDFERFGILIQIVGKLTRYANNFKDGGHVDSIQDLSVYAAILQQIDADALADREAEKDSDHDFPQIPLPDDVEDDNPDAYPDYVDQAPF